MQNAASLTFKDNDISKCYISFSGGAVFAFNTAVTVEGGVFKDNAAYGGGAMYLSSCLSVTISDALFTDNYAAQGGAIYADTGTVLTINKETVFRGNGAMEDGGTIKIANLASIFTDDIILEYNWSLD